MDLVLFDCDGTLVDSQVMIVSAMTRAFEASRLAPPPREEILSIVGLSLPIAVARLAGRHPAAPVDAVVDAYRIAFQDLRHSPSHQEPLYPGAREALMRLASAESVLLGIVTGKSRRGIDAILARHGLARYFQVVKTADDAPSKPHPQMVLDAVSEVGGSVGRTVVIGDTTYDMEMARAAGALPIGVSWGYHDPAMLRDAGALAVLDRYDDVDEAVAAALDSHGHRQTHA